MSAPARGFGDGRDGRIDDFVRGHDDSWGTEREGGGVGEWGRGGESAAGAERRGGGLPRGMREGGRNTAWNGECGGLLHVSPSAMGMF
ncbi:hypothetical protein SF23_19905 [Streptomyces sp. MBRL 10]|nr:hypothetical protein SF23_19905 [Streptomyces sp. MBRL 10]